MGAEVFRSRWIWSGEERWIESGALEIWRGRIRRVHATSGAVKRALRRATRTYDLGEACLAPGFVNAHAHLELSLARGAFAETRAFGAWVGALIDWRAARTPRELERSASHGAQLALAAGTTTVGDIDSTGASERALRRAALRHVLYREVLDAYDATRTARALAGIARALPRRALRREGLAPHAPFTVSPALWSGLERIAARRTVALTLHWAETRAELEWLERGSGPLAARLGPSPRCRGLELVRRAGLLDSRMSLVHGNFPSRGEPEQIASAGATLVHCPGSHAWFGREPFPFERYRRAGVRLALGTDSLASNDELDLRRELRLFDRAHSGLSPRELARLVTRHAAVALGFGAEVGALAPGSAADFVAVRADAKTAEGRTLAWLFGDAPIVGVWVAGRSAGAPAT